MQKLVANQYGIKYAKEAYEYYKEMKLDIDWEDRAERMTKMCLICYRLDTGDQDEAHLKEVTEQALSTWNYLWSSAQKLKTVS